MVLHLSISSGFVSSKIYDKLDDFDFEIHVVNVPYMEWDFPVLSLTVFTFLIRFARVSSHVTVSCIRLNEGPNIKLVDVFKLVGDLVLSVVCSFGAQLVIIFCFGCSVLLFHSHFQ